MHAASSSDRDRLVSHEAGMDHLLHDLRHALRPREEQAMTVQA
jgi:hypothetical protein